jgi:predicted MPP superfamily phosphohydrolase
MQAKKRFTKFSLILGVLFVVVGLLVYPIWSDLHAYFGGSIPVLQLLILLGGGYIGYCFYLLNSPVLTGERRSAHLVVMMLVDVLLLGLLILLIWNLGFASILLIRSLTQNISLIFWSGVVILVIWFWPRWRPLEKRTKVIIILILAVVSLIWISLPWQVNFTALPVVFMQQDGVTATWGTNMLSSYAITHGSTPAMEKIDRPQSHGLRDISEGITSAYLPGYPEGQSLYLKVTVDGIRQVKRSSTIKGGQTESPTIKINFPPEDDDLFLVSFSDIHEVNIVYEMVAKHIPWEQVDYALYLGDFVNDANKPEDFTENFLNLSTGGLNPPRVFARGNHETRGPGARALSDAFLPPDGFWYFTFSHGDTFFVVLDSGEDKLDSHVEYAGLVDFTSYHLEQADWLATVFESPEYQRANYQVVLVHIPPFATNYQSPAFQPVLDLLIDQTEIDLVMSGHTHRSGIWLPDETGWPYPITTNGGPLGVDTAAVTAHLTADGIQLNVINILGNMTESAWVPAK